MTVLPFPTLISTILLDDVTLTEVVRGYCASQGYELLKLSRLESDTSLVELHVRPLSGEALDAYKSTARTEYTEILEHLRELRAHVHATAHPPRDTPHGDAAVPTVSGPRIKKPNLVKDVVPPRYSRPMSKHLVEAISQEPLGPVDFVQVQETQGTYDPFITVPDKPTRAPVASVLTPEFFAQQGLELAGDDDDAFDDME